MKRYILLCFTILNFITTQSQIVFNSATTASGSGVSNLTFSKTVPAGNNRLLYVGVTIQDKGITSVKWNGITLTQFALGTRNSMRVGMYYVALGGSATPTTANVVVTIASPSDAFAGAADYTGVYQPAPFASPTVAQAKSTTPNVTFASSVGNLAVGLMGDISATPNANGSGQTQYWSFTGSHSNRSTQKAGAISVTMSHTLNASEDWVMIGGTMQDNAVMPIELTDFNVESLNNNSVSLKWQTATESQNDYFEIQKSLNGIDFTTLDKIKSKAQNGNSMQVLNYEAMDFTNLSTINYYRLKQVDFDGKYTYSNIESIKCLEKLNFTIAPNPFNESCTIEFEEEKTVKEIEIYNSKGLLVKQLPIYNFNEKFYRLNFSDIDPGIYYLKINGNTLKQKIIKQ